MMLQLKLFPIEFAGMTQHLYRVTQAQQRTPLSYQYLGDLVLLEYRAAWKPERIVAWKARNPKKQFRLSMKLSVAKALHESLQAQEHPSPVEQLFLNQLDHAIVNYQNPLAVSAYQIQAD